MTPNAVVLVIDRLGSGYLGPYGNTWIDTPAWNRLAAHATLFETALVDSPNLGTLYESYWRGRHALSDETPDTSRALDSSPTLLDLLNEKQVETWLVTDERQIAARADAQRFSQRVVLPAGNHQTADSLIETQLARLFANLVDVLHQASPPFLIWVHAQAMQGPWDAPYELRRKLADEEDPAPPDSAEPPELWLDEQCDPDLLLGFQQSYGAQVTVLDGCLDILLDSLWNSPLGDTTALFTTATRGFPLGEHRYAGRDHYPLFGELLQVPWLMSWPQGVGATWRLPHTVQPADLYATLCHWLEVPVSEHVWGRALLHPQIQSPLTPDQQVAVSVHEQQRALRVPGWFLRLDELDRAQLYVKPDDRWEFNDISTRCGQVIDELRTFYGQFSAAVRSGDRQQIPALPEMLQVGTS